MEIVIRAVVMFLFLWAVTRAVGRSTLGELSTFELLLYVTMGDLIQQAVTQQDYSVTSGVLAISVFALLTVVLNWTQWRFPRTRPVINGKPLVIVRDGEILATPTRQQRLSDGGSPGDRSPAGHPQHRRRGARGPRGRRQGLLLHPQRTRGRTRDRHLLLTACARRHPGVPASPVGSRRSSRQSPHRVWRRRAAPLRWWCSSNLGRGACAPRQPHDAVGRTHLSNDAGQVWLREGRPRTHEVRSGRQDSPVLNGHPSVARYGESSHPPARAHAPGPVRRGCTRARSTDGKAGASRLVPRSDRRGDFVVVTRIRTRNRAEEP